MFIVISFGAAQGRFGPAVLGAAAAVVVVVVAGLLARGPLERVPENAIKFAVGLLLTSFGTFWAAEGAGVDWPGDELSLLAVIAFVGALSFGLVRSLRRQRLCGARWSRRMRYVRAFGRFWWDFIVGDDWVVAAAVGLGLVLTGILTGLGVDAWWLMPVVVALALAGSLRRATRVTT